MMVESLMTMIRGQFYGDLPPEKWFKDRAFVKKNVVLWPATWLNARGLTLAPEKYEEIIVKKLIDLRQHAGLIQNPSGYLMCCLQDHFRHNEDALHDEAKAFTNSVANAVSKLSTAPAADPVAALATAASVIAPKRRQQGGDKKQGTLLLCALVAALLQDRCNGPAEGLKSGSNQSQSPMLSAEVGSNLVSAQKGPYSGQFLHIPA